MCDQCKTPNLSGFQGANPKTFKKKKEPKGLKPGKKTNEWEQARKEIKKNFEANGVTTCELKMKGCQNNYGLTFAHIDKRRNLTENELYSVALACLPCHQKIEALPHLEMRTIIGDIINGRSWG